MEFPVFNRKLTISRRRRNEILIATASLATGYALYRFYTNPSVVRKRNRVLRAISAFSNLLESSSAAAETLSVVSHDLSDFLRSNSDEIPNSVRQLSKIAASPEFSDSLMRATQSVVAGIVRGVKDQSEESERSTPGLIDRVLDRLFSVAGSGFASVVVGSFARNSVLALFPEERRGEFSGELVGTEPNSNSSRSPDSSDWVDLICRTKFRDAVSGWIQVFVSTAVGVYLEKTMDINPCDVLFSGMSNPAHEAKVKDLLVSLCNCSIENLVRTCHAVLSSPREGGVIPFGDSRNGKSEFSEVSTSGNGELSNCNGIVGDGIHRERDSNGWVGKVSNTLTSPSNRRFILDVTGKVTSESVRSFLDFTLWKLNSGLKNSMNLVVCNKGENVKELMKYACAKSMIVSTVCLALCLHVLVGMKALTPL